jgi:hypothetical protein
MPRIIGKEVFKNIVAMAYEMEVADRILTKVKQGLLEFSYERKYPTRFRHAEDIFDDITKLWKVAHTNKKHYELNVYDNTDELTQWVSKKKIALTTSGAYSAFARIIKFTSANGDIGSYLDVWREWDEYGSFTDEENDRVDIHNAPTTTTVFIIQRNIKENEKNHLKELLADVYWFRYAFRGLCKNRRVWEERLKEMEKRQLLVEKLSS